MMRALIKAEAGPGLVMDQASKPDFGPNEVLIRIIKTAICGTDVHIYNWDAWSARTIKPPMIIGHEFVGVIEAMGDEVRAVVEPGMRVSGEGHITCGMCRNCRAGRRHLCRNTVGVGVNRDGCMADWLVIPAVNAFPIPDSISDDTAACLDPFGNAAHTTLSFDLVGEDVLITGAGPIGIMAAALAKHVGARYVVVTDVNDYRLGLAARWADRTVNVTQEKLPDIQRELGMKEGFDVGLEMSGNPAAFQSMLDNMNHGGRIAMLGIFSQPLTVNSDQIIFKGLTIKGIYGREMFETWYKMVSVLTSGLDISPVITHRFKAEEFEKGFEVMNSGKSGKVILDW